nr:IPT/TIG domain-containing protein [Streptomyces chryseus]
MDPAALAVTATITTAGNPIVSAFSPDGATAYVTSYSSNSLAVIDTATNTVTENAPVGSGPYGVAVSPDGTLAYVANNASATLDVLRVATATPAPTVTAISPATGPIAGGTVVTITGTGLSGATAITFGATPATGISCTATSCTATAPAHAAGTVHVQVTTPGGTSATSVADQYTYLVPQAADIDVNVAAQPHLGILVPYLTYTLTAHNTDPDAVTSATVQASLPAGASATNLPTGCTASTTTVTCTYGAIANGASVNKSFRVPLHLLSLGQVKVTGTRTASAPTDPNPANNSASATCTVISIILATCP